MIYQSIRSLHGNWKSVYKYNGGISAFVRCLYGTMKLQKRSHNSNSEAGVDCVTFSVLPKMTALWTAFMHDAIDAQAKRIIIGNCSGGFIPTFSRNGSIEIIPVFNHSHGVKLDLFMSKVCKAEYVVVSDDDVFWLNSNPWKWAIGKLESDSDVAVVSLLPRERISRYLKGKVPQAIGSYCLVIRRELWLKENLRFEPVHPSRDDQYNWIYDTADFANVELLRRGYQIVIAPREVQQNLVRFEGISQWVLKIQKHAGNIHRLIVGKPLKQLKALQAIYVAKILSTIVADFWPRDHDPQIAPLHLLQKAEHICDELMDGSTKKKVRINIEDKLRLIRDSNLH